MIVEIRCSSSSVQLIEDMGKLMKDESVAEANETS